jgi:hypothetical protein
MIVWGVGHFSTVLYCTMENGINPVQLLELVKGVYSIVKYNTIL